MLSQKLIWPAFILMVMVQLFVPAKMIWDREEIMATGVEYKFKTAPIDPTDPFRGKYITLSFEENRVAVENEKEWRRGDEVFVILNRDTNGFAKITTAMKEKPIGDQDFLKTKVRLVSMNNKNELTIDYPFDRFYMEESKAYAAEETYRKVQRDSTKTTYALVSIRDGESVLKDVLIDGVPIGEMVKEMQE